MVRHVCATAALAALFAMSFLLGGCYNRAQRLYQRAEAFLAEGNSTLAAQEYRRLVIEDPRSPLADDALYKLGYLFREDFGDAAGAISIYQMLADQHPDSPYAPLSLLWMAYIQRRDLEDAAGVRASLEMLGNRYPDQQRTIARCQLELVRALYITGKYEEAMAEAELLQKSHPEHPWQTSSAALIQAKSAEKQMAEKEQVVALYEGIVERYPGTYSAEEAMRAIGRIYYGQRAEDQEREQEQLRRATRVIAGVPQFSDAGNPRRQQLAALNSLLAFHGARQQEQALLALSGAAFDFLYKPEDPTVAGRMFMRNPFVLVAEALGFTVNQWSASTAEGSFGTLAQAVQGGRPVLIRQSRPDRWLIVTGYRPAQDQVLFLAAGRQHSTATGKAELLRMWSGAASHGLGSYYQFSIVGRKHSPQAGDALQEVLQTAVSAIQGGQVSGVASGLAAYRTLEQQLLQQPSDEAASLMLWAERQVPELIRCRKAAEAYLREQAGRADGAKAENLLAAADVYQSIQRELETLAGAIRRAGHEPEDMAADAWARAAREVTFVSELEKQALTLLRQAAPD